MLSFKAQMLLQQSPQLRRRGTHPKGADL